ncbi:hypothetical protein O181_123007 [Austropuccinia psidii MF-1]|uniref:Reverse transcriptase Ty1/copia-type domain-containing protein n=1 Tax=Austropuccinia psidii MF-1 TaxID=1389203 RepID=A0A9Q3KP85_9BASI|nr:hypothetical protein [Austropuccinia psidii MF-1]
MENVSEIAPKNILSDIDESNIISEKRERKRPIYAVTVYNLQKNYHGAVNHPMASEWIEAINEEVKIITKHSVWKVVKIPQNANLLGSTWVFREEENSEGEFVQYKARLCVQGFPQIERIDFNETFAQTGMLNSLRFILSYCAHKDLEIHQMDVKTAFLYGSPEEDVFMKYPNGYPHERQEGTCLKLEQSLYGLKQSPRCWYQHLTSVFNKLEFYPSLADLCLFLKGTSVVCMVYVHVDDMIIGGMLEEVSNFEIKMREYFNMDYLRQANFILGIKIEIIRNQRLIYLSQPKHIKKILCKFAISNCKSVSTPMIPNSRLIPMKENEKIPEFAY